MPDTSRTRRSRPGEPKRRPHYQPLKKLAREYGFSYESLREAHFRGELPIVKVGKSDRYAAWYVERAQLEKWIASRTKTSAA